MRIVVNHVTRMEPGFMCVAGVDLETMSHVRPELRKGRLDIGMLEPNGGPFNMAALVDLGRARLCGRPPEVEDHRFSRRKAKKLGDVPADRFWKMLNGLARFSLREVFGEELQRHGETCTMEPGTGSASLGCLVPRGVPRLRVETSTWEGQQRIRIRVHVSDCDASYSLPVTDFRLYEPDQRTPRHELVKQVAVRIGSGVKVVLGVGFTRPLHGNRHWLQVNNIHLKDDPTWRLPGAG